MNNDLKLGAAALARGELQRLQDAAGTRVACISGCLWVTEQGSLRDVVLHAGEELDLQRNGLTVVAALDDSRWLHLATDAAPVSRTTNAGAVRNSLQALSKWAHHR